MDFKTHLEKAWHMTLNHLAPLILMTLVMSMVSFLSLGILAPVMLAGYVQSILRMLRDGREPEIKDLFSQMQLFLPLLLFSIVFLLAVLIGLKLFLLPGVAVVCVVTFGCIYSLPLMTDRKMGLLEALKASWGMAVEGNIADHVVVVILFIGFLSIGSSVFIGTLFTQPFATIFVLSVFLERTAQMPSPASGSGTPGGDPG